MTSLASPEVTLRAASAGDVEDIAALWHSGWIDGHLGHVPEAFHPHRRLDDFRQRVPGRLARTTVATIDSRVVGFVTLHDDELEQIYVAAPARGGGVAAALLRHGEQAIAARHDRAWLAVAVGNARARRFYTRQGWTDAASIDYEAEIAGGTLTVACRRYEKRVADQPSMDQGGT
jgi:ribosomal protein S18 acetylase RimI-like enzyme